MCTMIVQQVTIEGSGKGPAARGAGGDWSGGGDWGGGSDVGGDFGGSGGGGDW